MHTKVSKDNPFGINRYAYAWEHIVGRDTAHLDYGCGKGKLLKALAEKGIGRLAGVDVSSQAVELAKQDCGDIEIIHIKDGAKLPFSDDEFDSISLMDVLEHVYEQEDLLKELGRVLKADGKLIVTVPGRHLFSFLDIGNFKFRFPRLHRWYYCWKYSKAEYEKRYVNNPDGLVGDISAKKRWHEHFSRDKLKELLERCDFDVVEFDGTGYFFRLIHLLGVVPRKIGLAKIVRNLEDADLRRYESMNLYCLAKKKG